jgi:sugar/nucleoside kinase (ribokinase family)
MKVTLYGHMIVDKIFDGFKQTVSIGGIANVWHAIIKMNNKINVELSPCSFGEALIIVDKNSNSRIGRAVFDLRKNEIKIVDSEWSHIAYANQIENVDFISKLNSKYISVDLSKESPEKVLKIINYVDFLFMSEEDLFMDFDEIRKLCKGYVICHTPNGSLYGDKNIKKRYEIPKNLLLNNVNVLGAGDMFAGCFISNFLNGLDIDNCIIDSHKQTSYLIKYNNQ